jgi:hypothetical protein
VVSYSSIILLLYLLIFRISTQTCVQDLFDINFSWYVRYDTVSTYDTLILSLSSLINCDVSIFMGLDCMILTKIPPLWLVLDMIVACHYFLLIFKVMNMDSKVYDMIVACHREVPIPKTGKK